VLSYTIGAAFRQRGKTKRAAPNEAARHFADESLEIT
jgi:hypothetical protein